jgi:hypothetical protein
MRPLGSWVACDACERPGEDCDLCGGVGRVEMPLPGRVARLAAREGYLTDGYLCISDLTEGRCGHCTDLMEKEFAWMAHYARPSREDIEDCYERGDPKRAAMLDLLDRGAN